MRKTLFRGKRIDNGEWVYGYYVRLGDTHYILTGKLNLLNGVDFEKYTVVPETVGQYTGLKDKNGTKIFEGDIVICKKYIGGNFIDEHIEIGYVEMKYGAFGLHRKQGWYRPFKDWLEDYEYEVIGNIYENPELLEGNKK